jgi:DNA (cytosine-5)-methyltransferase 1
MLTLAPPASPLVKPPRLKVTSSFSGIGGFDIGFERAGMEVTNQIEWDPSCQMVLKKHYPHVNLMGDISEVRGTDLGRVDVSVGGFPCQDTSIAAPHRSGLAGRRSGHFFEFARLVEESARLWEDTSPEWVVIENPTGLLKSNGGRDMATVVRTLEDLGYGWAYRVVDGRYLGSPQRRERILLVGRRGADPRSVWEVLGDEAGRAQAHRASQVGRSPIGLAPAGGATFDAVWRKSARPRAALSEGGYETWVADGISNTLTGFDGGGPARQTHLIAQHGRVRTLTFTEWERLQGFPDGWTDGVPDGDLRRKKVLIRAGRYTVLGNAMHVGMAEWLGRRIVAAHAASLAA